MFTASVGHPGAIRAWRAISPVSDTLSEARLKAEQAFALLTQPVINHASSRSGTVYRPEAETRQEILRNELRAINEFPHEIQVGVISTLTDTQIKKTLKANSGRKYFYGGRGGGGRNFSVRKGGHFSRWSQT